MSRKIEEITVDELADLWLLIGGAPHLFHEDALRWWLSSGEILDGIEFGANEIIQVGVWLYSKGFTGDSRSDWDLTNVHEAIKGIQRN